MGEKVKHRATCDNRAWPALQQLTNAILETMNSESILSVDIRRDVGNRLVALVAFGDSQHEDYVLFEATEGVAAVERVSLPPEIVHSLAGRYHTGLALRERHEDG